MGFLDKLFGKRVFDPSERRRKLLANGRITDGVIIDTHFDDSGNEAAHFLYTLNGVDFESVETLTDEQRNDPVNYAPGSKIAIRYDPKNQGNAIIE